MKKKFKAIACEIKEINEEERSFLAVASTEDIDRDNDRIMSGFVKDGRLMFRPKFASYDEYPFADTIFKLYKGGFLRSFSVGFNPTRYETVERGEKGSRGYDFIEQELWEVSACTVPSNPNALVAAKAKGVIGEEEFGAAQDVWEKVAVEGEERKEEREKRKRGNGDLEIEKRVDELEALAKKNGIKELRGEIEVLKSDITALKEAAEAGNRKEERGNSEPEPEGHETDDPATPGQAETRDEDVIETVGEAVTAALAKVDIGEIIDKRVKYHMGIVE